MKLTNDIVKNSMPEPGKRLELRDDDEKGLILRVTDNGRRSWSVRYRNAAGEQRRKNIGAFPVIGLSKAREQARLIKGAVAANADPVAEEREAKAAELRKRLHSLSGLADAYFAAAAEGTHRGGTRARPKRESTLNEEKRVFNKFVKPRFGDSAVASITRIEIRDFVTKQSRRAVSNGRVCRDIIRQLLNYAVREGVIDHNPALDIPVAISTPRERVLKDDELRAIWNACERPHEVPGLALSLEMGIALRMAAVTLQRGGEVVGMRWQEIDEGNRLWTIPAVRMKGKRTHTVPLSDLAMELLADARETIGGADYVFQSPRSEMHMDRRAFSRAMKRIVTALDIDDATPHDLRRTGSSRLTSERIGMPRFVVSQVLGHAGDTGGAAVVTGRHYDQYDYASEKRRALDAWSAYLSEVVSGRERPRNVIGMGKRPRR